MKGGILTVFLLIHSLSSLAPLLVAVRLIACNKLPRNTLSLMVDLISSDRMLFLSMAMTCLLSYRSGGWSFMLSP